MKRLLPVLAAVACAACAGGGTATSATPAQGMIPVTSKSAQALEHFRKGEALFDNLRTAEAAEAFAEAVKIEPDFVLAHALHGQAVFGPAGLKEVDEAASKAAALPEAERTYIQAMQASSQGDLVKSEAAWRRLTTLAPADWHAQNGLGQRLFGNRDYDGAAAAFKKATELNPKAGPAFNMLGYSSLRKGDANAAIDAFQHYVSVSPQEPNAQDSLGEALMASGKFQEAEAAFRKAAELSPRFWNAWEGVAYARFYAGDWAGGREAVTKAIAAAERPNDKVAAAELLAWGALAEGKGPDALAAFDAAEKTAGAQPADVASVPIHRAVALVELGRAREALPLIAAVIQRAESGAYPESLARTVRRDALVARAYAESALNQAADVEKTAGILADDSAARPDDAVLQSAKRFTAALSEAAKKNFAAAEIHTSACSTLDARCQMQALVVATAGGDRAAADAARARITRLYVRDPDYLLVRSRLARESKKAT